MGSAKSDIEIAQEAKILPIKEVASGLGITEDELEWLEINVDVLGEPEDIDSIDQLDVKRYGVIVSCGNRRGLLLPDLDGVDDVETQVSIAMRKGGIREDDDYTLQRFEVIRHK